MARRASLQARIARRVIIAPCPLPLSTPCWLWKWSLTYNGYGRVSVRSPGIRRHVRAHRAAYVAWVGPIPAGLDLDHLCRVRTCCNPLHLEPVTRLENVRRGLLMGGDVQRKNVARAKARGAEASR